MVDVPLAGRTPTGRKVQLAALLRHLREQKHLTQEDAGGAVWPDSSTSAVQNKIASVESANTGIEREDLCRLLDVYGIERGVILDLALQLHANGSQRGRWSGHRSIYSKSFRRYIDLEEDADTIRHVTNERVPELLQCESYIRAGFSTSTDGPDSAENQMAAATLARQETVLFRRDPVKLYVVLSESCVRRVQGDDAVMRAQIEHLIVLAARPNISIQLVPFRPEPRTRAVIANQGIADRFALLRLAAPGVIGTFHRHLDYAYTRTGSELEWDGNVQPYEDLWNRAASAALTPNETHAFLHAVARDYS
jgi:hypothetical protein